MWNGRGVDIVKNIMFDFIIQCLKFVTLISKLIHEVVLHNLQEAAVTHCCKFSIILIVHCSYEYFYT